MILAPNRRQLLSGSKLAVIVLAIFLAACSKKTTPVSKPTDVKPDVEKVPEKSVPAKRRAHSIALILPFNLDKINPKTALAKDISGADLAIDFYQGFKLALDSLSEESGNFMLQVFDSRENELQIVNLARARSVMNNDLIIGPVFPEQISIFSEFADLDKKLMVSPLAAADPKQFGNGNLLTFNNTIDQHGWKIADFINRNYKPKDVNIVLINTQSNDDEKFSAPFRNYLNQLSESSFLINQRTNAIGLEEHLSATKTNLIIIASTSRNFLLPTIDRLYKVGQLGVKIEVFGHPSWSKAQFLNAEKMQWLNTRITSSYFINYKAKNVKQFIARYIDDYGFDPNEYAFKGFDTGYYFGKLLTRYGTDYVKHITDGKYEGLHNQFRFVKEEKSGYLNAELMILKYQGYELKIEE